MTLFFSRSQEYKTNVSMNVRMILILVTIAAIGVAMYKWWGDKLPFFAKEDKSDAGADDGSSGNDESKKEPLASTMTDISQQYHVSPSRALGIAQNLLGEFVFNMLKFEQPTDDTCVLEAYTYNPRTGETVAKRIEMHIDHDKMKATLKSAPVVLNHDVGENSLFVHTAALGVQEKMPPPSPASSGSGGGEFIVVEEHVDAITLSAARNYLLTHRNFTANDLRLYAHGSAHAPEKLMRKMTNEVAEYLVKNGVETDSTKAQRLAKKAIDDLLSDDDEAERSDNAVYAAAKPFSSPYVPDPTKPEPTMKELIDYAMLRKLPEMPKDRLVDELTFGKSMLALLG